MDVALYIDGRLRTDLTVERLKRSYVEPWSAELFYNGRHEDRPVGLWQEVEVVRSDNDRRLFYGNITQVSPGGVAEEGVQVLAQCRRFRLENEPVNINGAGYYIWNRRGHRCQAGFGEDSPGRDGGLWTAGEIIIDILEHALGVPAAGSAIAGHHGSPGCCIETYLTTDDIVGYNAADWLALDTVVGEFSVDNTPVAAAISELLALTGGFYGWFLTPWGYLTLVDLADLPETDLEAGELGQWQDAAGHSYALLDNSLDWSLDGVYSEVMVQGADRTVEVKPADLDGCGNAALNGGGELELIAAPWKGYGSAYRALDQPYREWTWKGVGMSGSCEDWWTKCECGIPAGLIGIYSGPRIYRGQVGGAKSIVSSPIAGGSWRVNLATGIVAFSWDISAELDPGERLWGWYWSKVPFTVRAGPSGTAYRCLGYERTLKIYDGAFKHPTSYPVAGEADEETAMELLAERTLEQLRDVRMQGRLVCDGVDPEVIYLRRCYNVTRLVEPTTTPAPTTTPGCPVDPLDWARLRLNAIEIVYDLAQNTTELTVANTFWMLEGYSAIKERFKLNLFARRELALSEDILDCQVGPSSGSPEDESTVILTTTTTTTGPPPTTTTAAPGGTTTTGPPPGTTTAAPTTTTTTPEGGGGAGGCEVICVTLSNYSGACAILNGSHEMCWDEDARRWRIDQCAPNPDWSGWVSWYRPITAWVLEVLGGGCHACFGNSNLPPENPLWPTVEDCPPKTGWIIDWPGYCADSPYSGTATVSYGECP